MSYFDRWVHPDVTNVGANAGDARSMRPLIMLALAGLAGSVAGRAAAQDSPAPPRQQKEKEVKLKTRLDDRLKFMAGCWEGRIDQETTVEEIWNNPSQNLMTSTTRYLRNGRATSYEFSRVVSADSTVTFSASSEGKPFDEYIMVQLVDEYVVFENLKKSFPQRISYRLASNGDLIPRNEGEGQPSVEVRFKRVKCPGT
jgi:hypothetical protein